MIKGCYAERHEHQQKTMNMSSVLSKSMRTLGINCATLYVCVRFSISLPLIAFLLLWGWLPVSSSFYLLLSANNTPVSDGCSVPNKGLISLMRNS